MCQRLQEFVVNLLLVFFVSAHVWWCTTVWFALKSVFLHVHVNACGKAIVYPYCTSVLVPSLYLYLYCTSFLVLSLHLHFSDCLLVLSQGFLVTWLTYSTYVHAAFLEPMVFRDCGNGRNSRNQYSEAELVVSVEGMWLSAMLALPCC